jgi:hypothetical protein
MLKLKSAACIRGIRRSGSGGSGLVFGFYKVGFVCAYSRVCVCGVAVEVEKGRGGKQWCDAEYFDN